MFVQKSSSEANTDESSEPPEPPGPAQILIIYSMIEALERGVSGDLVADLETAYIAQMAADALRSKGQTVSMAAIRSEGDIAAAVAGYDPRTTLVFNLCEALGGDSSGEARVPHLLDKLGYCYVGGSSENLSACLDKSHTKARLLKRGVSTAPYQVFHRPDEPIQVPLPAIVKPVAEDCSLGIDRDAVVSDAASLRRRVAYILEVYKQAALVEMFLDGREFNVSIWGNGTAHVLPVAEGVFPDWADTNIRVMNFDSKWTAEAPEFTQFAVQVPAQVDAELEQCICRTALAAYQTMGCRDYARVDMREKDGQVYVLEVNPNPCLAPDSGFSNTARAAGYDYGQMLHQIATWAWWRVQERQ